MREKNTYLVRVANTERTNIIVRAYNIAEAEHKTLTHCKGNDSVIASDGSLNSKYIDGDKKVQVTFIERMFHDFID